MGRSAQLLACHDRRGQPTRYQWRDYAPAGFRSSVLNAVDVPCVDEFIGKITGAGGTVVMPKTAVPGIGYLACFADTEGNVFGMMQNDPSAR